VVEHGPATRCHLREPPPTPAPSPERERRTDDAATARANELRALLGRALESDEPARRKMIADLAAADPALAAELAELVAADESGSVLDGNVRGLVFELGAAEAADEAVTLEREVATDSQRTGVASPAAVAGGAEDASRAARRHALLLVGGMAVGLVSFLAPLAWRGCGAERVRSVDAARPADSALALRERAAAADRAGDTARAVAYLREAVRAEERHLASGPGDAGAARLADALLALGAALSAAGDPQAALEPLGRAGSLVERIAPSSAPDGERSRLAYAIATETSLAEHRLGRPERALAGQGRAAGEVERALAGPTPRGWPRLPFDAIACFRDLGDLHRQLAEDERVPDVRRRHLLAAREAYQRAATAGAGVIAGSQARTEDRAIHASLPALLDEVERRLAAEPRGR